MKAAAFPASESTRSRGARVAVAEAAPARWRIRVLAWLLVLGFLGLAARASQLAFAGDPLAGKNSVEEGAPVLARADLVDRNGVLLATALPSFALVAEPAKVWDAAATARELARLFPDLGKAGLEKRLADKSRALVYLKRDLTPRQRSAVFEKGLAGISFRDESTRVYPQGRMAAHLIGIVNDKDHGAAGVESGLDAEILNAGALGKAVRLSIDVRIQHALEAELDGAVDATRAQGGAGIVLDGRTGEVLAMASAPRFNPNDPPVGDDGRRLNRAAGAVYEMGSSLKPFTVAMGLEAGVTRADEVFDLSHTLTVEGYEIKDYKGLNRPATLPEALAESSNIMAATIAMRVGPERQRQALKQLGLFERAPLQIPETARPLPPQKDDLITNAVLGYGHGMAFSIAALAEAYTVFANSGARAPLTLLARAQGDQIARVPVFTKATTDTVLGMMRGVVTEGTGRRADAAGLEIAGKTGSAEKPNNRGVYEADVLFSSFAAVFPASNPKYVVLIAVDEPQRTAATENLATGGAVAAPAVGRVAARMAPLVGLSAKGAVQ